MKNKNVNKKFGFTFNYRCKCGNDDPNKFLNKKFGSNGVTLLCFYCERIVEILLTFKEKD